MNYPQNKVQGVEEIVDAMRNLIVRNIIAKIDLSSDASIGDTVIYVENSFQFRKNEEIIFVDDTYNVEGGTHYQVFEYAKIKSIDDTDQITLVNALEGNWLTSDNAKIQKTIGHNPLFENFVYYGDREVIPTENMAVTIEPKSLSNEWMYLQGGLNEEYSLSINVFGKDIKAEDGARILHRYTHAIYQLLNDRMHFDVDFQHTPLLTDSLTGTNKLYIQDTEENREFFVVSDPPATYEYASSYEVQDNKKATCSYKVTNRSIGGGIITLTLDENLASDFAIADFAIVKRTFRYFWDSRATAINYGVVNKGSAFIRAAEITWMGKTINEHSFPQWSKNIPVADRITENESSSSSSSSSS